MGTRARRDREKQQRQQDIRESAKTLFRHKGLAGTTIRDIAAACELASGTIYLYYRNKDEIFADLLVEGHDLLIQRLEKALDSVKPSKRGGALIDAFFAFAVDNPAYFELMFFVAQREGKGILDVAAPAGVFHQRLQQQQQRCLELASTAIRGTAAKAGDEAVFLTAEAAWSMLAGVVHYFLKEGPGLFEPVSRQARKILLNYFERMDK